LFKRSQDTIFALATGTRKSAIAVFRISGPKCNDALATLAPSRAFPARRAVLRTLRNPVSGRAIDTCLVTRFVAPASFTGEDLAEIGVTGGRAVVAAMVSALGGIEGLRPAEPGEFSWRAFVNGRMDLSAAEGLADLVDAETEAQREQALRIAGGALRRECHEIRAALLEAMTMVEAALDFSDGEGLDERFLLIEALAAVAVTKVRICGALDNSSKSSRLREGFSVVIAGPPNVGKSTLMNVLSGRDVAITSPVPGTTRDPIEVFLDLRGYPVVVVDTAGIRSSVDPIEREGIERAKRRAEAADLVLWLHDTDGPESVSFGTTVYTVRTKIDAAPRMADAAREQRNFDISAKTGSGIKELLAAIGDLAEERMSGSEFAPLPLERHKWAFKEALAALDSAASSDRDLELVAEDLRRAASALDRLIGRVGVEEVLSQIFSRLCVGK